MPAMDGWEFLQRYEALPQAHKSSIIVIMLTTSFNPEDELKALPTGWKVAAMHELKVPGLDEQRHLVEICRSHDRL
jgi:CheY-like chemotaxis protein